MCSHSAVVLFSGSTGSSLEQGNCVGPRWLCIMWAVPRFIFQQSNILPMLVIVLLNVRYVARHKLTNGLQIPFKINYLSLLKIWLRLLILKWRWNLLRCARDLSFPLIRAPTALYTPKLARQKLKVLLNIEIIQLRNN